MYDTTNNEQVVGTYGAIEWLARKRGLTFSAVAQAIQRKSLLEGRYIVEWVEIDLEEN